MQLRDQTQETSKTKFNKNEKATESRLKGPRVSEATGILA